MAPTNPLVPVTHTEGSSATVRRKDSLTLAVASVINGLTAYAIAAVGSWAYGAEAFGPFANLWTVLVLALAAVTFPLQHWIIRTVAIAGGEQPIRDSFGRVARAVVGLGLVVGGVLWILSDTLFAGASLFALIAGILIVESGIIGLSRGVLVARGRIQSAAVVMGGENLVRLGTAGLVLVAGLGVPAYGAAVLSGVVIVALFPTSVRPEATGRGGAERVLSMLGGIGGGTLLSQIVLVSAPLVVAMQTDRFDLVTAMFATTALARAPFLIALGLGLQATSVMSARLATDPRVTARSSMRLAIAGVPLSMVGGMIYGYLAPVIVPALFGPETSLSVVDSALVGCAATFAVVSLFMSLILVVAGKGMSITSAWAVAVAVGIGVLAVVPLSVTTSTAVAFLAAEVVAFVALTAFAQIGEGSDLYLRSRRLER